MRFLGSIAILALIASTASAHAGYKIKLTAQYKESKKGSTSFRNIFIQGHAHYPNGTVLSVMIRPEKAGYLPMTVRATVQKEEFAAEMGPWKEGFPAGKYVCEAWFEFDKQTEAVKNELKQTDEFAKCLVEDPAYQEQYKKENPERYEKLMREISVTGKCASNKQFGTCEMNIGSADDAAQSDETEKAFLRDRADLVKDMLTDLMKAYAKHSDPNKGSDCTAESYQTWSSDFETQRGQLDTEISGKLHEMVFNTRKETYELLGNAIRDLGDLQQNLQATLYGEASKKMADLKDLLGKKDADKDEKRRREVLKKEMAQLENDREDCERRFVENLAQAYYGHKGLEPAPERLRKWIEERKTEFGFQWKD